mgnify:CR=1 FL=1
MIFRYKIADIVFDADIRYRYTYNVMKDYLVDDEPARFSIVVTDEDLENEKKLSPYELSAPYYESTAVYRKYIYEVLNKYDAFFFHCSSIAVDNKAIMFTAKSGTGKSTHRNLWIKNYGDKVTVINDDKPIIRKIDGVFYVFGTPWQGKENLGNNIKVPAKALCFLSRSEENSVGPLETSEVIARALNQTVRPKETELMSNLLDLLEGFINQVDCYDLRVNMEDDAAITAYNAIIKE